MYITSMPCINLKMEGGTRQALVILFSYLRVETLRILDIAYPESMRYSHVVGMWEPGHHRPAFEQLHEDLHGF